MVEFECIRNYSGWWITVSHGWRACACFPFTDEPRIPVKTGDKIIVSRGNRDWLYGDMVLGPKERKGKFKFQRLDSLNKQLTFCFCLFTNTFYLYVEGKRVRGWFPRCCARKIETTNEDIKKEN